MNLIMKASKILAHTLKAAMMKVASRAASPKEDSQKVDMEVVNKKEDSEEASQRDFPAVTPAAGRKLRRVSLALERESNLN